MAEDIVWEIVRGGRLGFKFKREVPIGPYRLDFYCAEAKVCLEMDGEQHDAARDAVRDQYLEKLGIVTFRIPNIEFFELEPGAPYGNHIEELIRLCEERSGRFRF
ncbi:MAG: DUF559 domain-containing protein [Armatimonadetes bacterium]|nr:DUF559 domain-containing protein [Armatimonadota bacterium]MBS1727957.1 DUF559 domain-containing protein [Armatimonadota bacterium]